MADLRYQRSIERAVEILRQHPNCVALTGAGLSTRSGIPDFRSPGTGLWYQIEKMPDDQSKVMSIQGFKEKPEEFFKHFRYLLENLLSAEPNPAHIALAELEASGHIQAIVTQNADMLHQKAGSQAVIEIHGTIARAICISCYRAEDGLGHWKRLLAEDKLPRCRYCGGVMKPDVILPGEQLPVQAVLKAKRLFQTCDVILAAGTSFAGGPVTDWIEQATEQGKKLVILNLSPTILDSVADVVIKEDVVEVLPSIVEKLSVS